MSFKSPYPPVEIPEDAIYEALFGSISEEDLDRTALIDAGATEGTTYRELIDRINAFAGALAARGVEVGDKVALLSPNTSAFAFVFHGIDYDNRGFAVLRDCLRLMTSRRDDHAESSFGILDRP